MHKLIKAIKANGMNESDTFQRIKLESKKRNKFMNKDVSLAPVLPALCTYLDIIQTRELSAWELGEFNDLITRFLGALLEQEMTAAGIVWSWFAKKGNWLEPGSFIPHWEWICWKDIDGI